MTGCSHRRNDEAPADAARRTLMLQTAAVAVTGAAAVTGFAPAAMAALDADKRKFIQEATDLAIESVKKGWGGPFGDRKGRRGRRARTEPRSAHRLSRVPRRGHGDHRRLRQAQPRGLARHRVRPRHHPREDPGGPDSPGLVPERARMLKGCDIYINAAPCPMCTSAIYWARIDRVYFGNSLEDTSKIGFDDAFQYADFKLPWSKLHIPVAENFEDRDDADGRLSVPLCLQALRGATEAEKRPLLRLLLLWIGPLPALTGATSTPGRMRRSPNPNPPPRRAPHPSYAAPAHSR
jgi:guanine deaminase